MRCIVYTNFWYSDSDAKPQRAVSREKVVYLLSVTGYCASVTLHRCTRQPPLQHSPMLGPTDAAPQNQAPRCLLAWVNPRIGWLIYPLCLRSPRTIGAMSSQGLQLKSSPQIAAPKTLQPCCVVRAYFLKRTVRSIGVSLQVTLPASSAQLSRHLKDPHPLQANSIASYRQKPQT